MKKIILLGIIFCLMISNVLAITATMVQGTKRVVRDLTIGDLVTGQVIVLNDNDYQTTVDLIGDDRIQLNESQLLLDPYAEGIFNYQILFNGTDTYKFYVQFTGNETASLSGQVVLICAEVCEPEPEVTEPVIIPAPIAEKPKTSSGGGGGGSPIVKQLNSTKIEVEENKTEFINITLDLEELTENITAPLVIKPIKNDGTIEEEVIIEETNDNTLYIIMGIVLVGLFVLFLVLVKRKNNEEKNNSDNNSE